MASKKNIIYFYPQPSTFNLRDIEILAIEYDVNYNSTINSIDFSTYS